MAKIEITRTELVWPGKYDDEGNLVPPRRVSLPFQVIERVNETRATREQRKEELGGFVGTLFDYWQLEEEQKADPGDGWRNKLIWGDNLYVMGSLLEHFAGQVDLIYIDPPFATGVDFSFSAPIGDRNLELTKKQSIIEEKAYRDTWGRDLESYLTMLSERLALMHDLLSSDGTIWVHLDDYAGHYVKIVLDEIYGRDRKMNQIIWHYPDNFQGNLNRYANNHNFILVYGRSTDVKLKRVKIPLDKPVKRDKRVWDKELQKIGSARRVWQHNIRGIHGECNTELTKARGSPKSASDATP